MENNGLGQYGKRNPLFMYQGTAGYSIKAALYSTEDSKATVQAYTAVPPQSGQDRCGTMP